MNKAQLLKALDEEHERFIELFVDCNEEAMLTPDPESGWTLKDVLSHLTRWEAELVKLLWNIRQGQKPSTAHFSSSSVDEINAQWRSADQSRPLERILQDYHGIRNQTLRRVEEFSDRELEDPNRYPWLQGRALWEWIAGDSFEHESEHIFQAQAILKAYRLNHPMEG